MPRQRTGSVRFKEGAWRIQVSLGKDPKGQRRFKRESVYEPNTKAGEAVARKTLAKLLVEVEADLHPAVERGTFSDIMERWIDTRGADWPDGAAKHVRQVLDNHVVPTLGAKPIDRIRPVDIDELYAALRRKGLAPATIKRIHNNLHAVLAQAVKWEMIAKNPASVASPPRVPKAGRRDLPDAEAVRRAIAGVKPWLAIFIRLAVHTGMRRGELIRLRWDNIDLDAGVIQVLQTKTDNEKTIPLGAGTLAVLKEWRAVVCAQSLAIGNGDPAWVFPAHFRSGKLRGTGHMKPDSATRAWTRARETYGLDRVRLHDLRHTMATRLLKSHADVGTVAARGGWANAAILLSTYDQPVHEADLAAAAFMDDWLDETG